MIFRKAAYFYWLSRYLTRALDTIRLVEAYWPLCWDGGKGRGEASLIRLRQALRMSAPGPIFGPAGELFWFLEATENPLSVRSSIEAARSNARLLREELPEELWEMLGELPSGLPAVPPAPLLETPFPWSVFLHRVQGISAIYEIARFSLVQGAGPDCLALGQAIEGMGNLTAALSALVPDESGSPPPSPEEEAAILCGFCSLDAYRATFGPCYEDEPVCRALLGDRRIPRSFAALLQSVSASLERLEKSSTYTLSSASESALALRAALASLGGTSKNRLSYLLVELQIGCNQLHQEIEKALV
ncbi:alpha-E domain-containing protein [Methylacidimicrobium sp. B4]|uniref:alpha-E domain-containing protein n=1 Tax=Methylacidimicrobium sp. B4 TaxID=2796139 RepID=UPI001A8CF47D|nr:alpha-E domain-containing protein [Methylacidimicrobium sp. B4]QSR84276.1 alpha-E domain-containing protein [Methylacidimicrobium sp. B4]